MPITVECNGCGKQYRVSDQAAGKKLRCRNCGRDMMVPAAAAGDEETDPLEALIAMERNAAPTTSRPLRKPLIPQKPPEMVPFEGGSLRESRPAARFGRSKRLTVGTDNLSPWAVILFVVLQLAGAIVGTVHANHVAGAAHGKEVGAIWTVAILNVVVLFAVLGPAVWLGVFITSKILRFQLVDLGYLRGCGIASIPGLIWAAAALIPAGAAQQMGPTFGKMLLVLIFVACFLALTYVFDLDWVGGLVSYAFAGPLYAAALALAANIILALVAQAFGSGTIPPRNWFDRQDLVQASPPPLTAAPEPNSNPASPPPPSSADLEANTAKTEDNLKQIGQVAQHFAGLNDKGAFPPALDALVTTGDLPAQCLNSPFGRPKPGGYFYWPDRMAGMPGDVAVAYDAAELSSQGGTHVLFANGNVEYRSSAQFATLVGQSNQSVLDWQGDQRIKEQKRQEAMAHAASTPAPTDSTPAVPKPLDFAGLFMAQKPAFVASVKTVPVEGPFRSVVTPLTPSAWVALIRDGGPTQDNIELWDLNAAQKKAETSFTHEAGAQEPYAISPDGAFLARVSDFPKLGVRIWSTKEARDTRTIVLNQALGTPTLAGFLNGEKFAVIWDRGNDEGIEIWDATTGQRARQIPLQPYKRTINNGVFNSDGREIASTSAQIPRGSPQVDFYNLYGLPGTRRWHEIMDVDAADVDAPAGMAYSPDGKKMAALFAKQGGRLYHLLARRRRQADRRIRGGRPRGRRRAKPRARMGP
jgi:hypothetical protein